MQIAHKRMRAVFAVALCLQFVLPTATLALPPESEEKEIDALTNQILRKEIDLERYYLQYRVYGTKEPKTRRLRYYALQTASAATGLASQIGFTQIFYRQRRNLDLDQNRATKNAFKTGIVSICLDGGSSMIELTSNSLLALKNIKEKKSPGAAVKEVIGRVKDIDALRAQRDALVQKFPESDLARVYRAEGRVLKCFRDWCLSEFADVYADVKALQASYNVYYVMDIIADSFYLAAYILGLKSLSVPADTQPAITTGLIGDAFGIASAPMSSRGYYVIAKFHRNRLKKKLQETLKDSEEDTKSAMNELKAELQSKDIATLEGTCSANNRAAAYVLWSARFDQYLEDILEDLRHANKVALQGELTGPLISGTYLSQDIAAQVALSRLGRRPRATNDLGMAVSIGATAGTGFSLFLTNYWFFDELRFKRKLKKKKHLPEQLLAQRLKTLDDLDSLLISSSKPQNIQ